MSLCCHETIRDITYGTPLRCTTHGVIDTFSALSQEIFEQIPERAKRSTPCEEEECGVDVHTANSSKNGGVRDNYPMLDFKMGEFLFSLSPEDAAKYLPKSKAMVETNFAEKN